MAIFNGFFYVSQRLQRHPVQRRHRQVQRVPPAAAAVAAATAVSAPAMAEEGGGLLDFGKARLWKPRTYPWEIHGKSMGTSSCLGEI